jgi:hypothetical protein
LNAPGSGCVMSKFPMTLAVPIGISAALARISPAAGAAAEGDVLSPVLHATASGHTAAPMSAARRGISGIDTRLG